MTRKKSAVSRSRRRSVSRRKTVSPRRISRFLKACSSTALLSFAAASWVLNPQWQNAWDWRVWLADLGWPQQEVALATQPAPLDGVYAQTQFSECREFFPAATLPVVPARPKLRELCFDSFAILHDGVNKTPVFVAQRLSRQTLQQARHISRTDRFYPEARLPSAERAELADYRGSGYSRGHMAPAGDMHTPEAMAQSFSLANMVPQNQVQNAGAWNKIEQDTRKYVMRSRGPVYIFTGPVYGERPKRIGEGGVAVPAMLYKVVHDVSTGHTVVHWQANHEGARAGQRISYEQFVQRTGLHLLGTAG